MPTERDRPFRLGLPPAAEEAPTKFERDAEGFLDGLKDPRADGDLAQMQAALAAEGYAWVHPLDGSPRRLMKVGPSKQEAA